MQRYEIVGGSELDGKLKIKGAKNSILPLLAASIMADQKVTFFNYPHISDVDNMINILSSLGCKIVKSDEYITVDSSNINECEITTSLASRLRSSIFLLGPLLSRFKKAHVAYPGGCDIGLRPIDIHVEGFKELGIEVLERSGMIFCDSSKAKAGEVILDLPSVGATENIMMACVFLKGESIIRNCAKEPEVVDLQNFLNKLGANIKGAGSATIRIEGVGKLFGCEYEPIPDRIVLGTYMVALAMCGGTIEFNNYNKEHISLLLSKLSKSSCKISAKNGKMLMKSFGRPKCIEHIETMYYPGFPTDLQAQVLAMQTISEGSSLIVENIFETRYKPVSQLIKMGANILVKGKTAFIRGVEKLHASEVVASDLRGGASLVLAGLVAEGKTVVNNIAYIDRGYEDMAKILNSLGANIKRINDE